MAQIAVCGSMSFMSEMEKLADGLQAVGHFCFLPIREEEALDWNSLSQDDRLALKRHFIKSHLHKIQKADGVLLANFTKHGIDGYIGANTLMEAAFSYAFGKPVFALFEIGPQSCQIEIQSIVTAVLKGDLRQLKI